MKKMLNQISRFCLQRSSGLLVLRVATGLVFLTHGWMKVEALSRTMEMFGHMGFMPEVGIFIAWLEVLGGLGLILGVATRMFGVAFGIEMVVAAALMGFARGITFELYLALASFAIALMGSGRYSIFPVECRECGGMLCKPGSEDCMKK